MTSTKMMKMKMRADSSFDNDDGDGNEFVVEVMVVNALVMTNMAVTVLITIVATVMMMAF